MSSNIPSSGNFGPCKTDPFTAWSRGKVVHVLRVASQVLGRLPLLFNHFCADHSSNYFRQGDTPAPSCSDGLASYSL